MKKVILILVMAFTFVQLNATTEDAKNHFNATPPANCWAAAEAAETLICGSPGCSFEVFDAVMSACLGLKQ